MKKIIWTLSLLLAIIFFLFDQNNRMEISFIEIKDSQLPAKFKNYKILHISDLHNKNFGKKQEKLIKEIVEISPDLIVITGDLIDRRRYNEEISLQLIQGIVDIAPIYLVSGNHEWWSGKWNSLRPKLEQYGVKVLGNSRYTIEKDGESILIFGIEDPAKYTGGYQEKEAYLEEDLKSVVGERYKDKFSILLAHRPEKFKTYSKYGVNLIFSGHAHGGQFRIPGIGGIWVPGQGFLPKYTSGMYQLGNSKMIVSRGLGNSIFPQRLFNRPELVVVTLNMET